jgi:23S rRNA pseudouridine1911/1915/1917 synthase
MPQFSVEPNEAVTFKIRFEDEHLLVVDKPAHMVTQPGLAHTDDSLLNGLFALHGTRLQNLGKDRDFGLLHRLDRETSGLLIVGLTRTTYDHLRQQFEDRKIRKYYWAVVEGELTKPVGLVNKPIIETSGRDSRENKMRAKLARISGAGKPSQTAYRVLSHNLAASVVECRPLTGRLHQVRVHMDAIGASILGDDLYGPARVGNACNRLALHAHRVVFTHPVTGEEIDVQSPWPSDLKSLLRRLKLPRPDAAGQSHPGVRRLKSTEEVDGDGVGDDEA